MTDKLYLMPLEAERGKSIEKIEECNKISSVYGLSLSETQIIHMLESTRRALKNTGRIELGQSILPRLIEEFCTSPFIYQQNYEETLSELQEAFYYFKAQSRETAADDDLIADMKRVFNGAAQGSMEYLTGLSVEELRHDIIEDDREVERWEDEF